MGLYDLPPLHPQVQDYLRASESLISAALVSHEPFSEEEILLVADYMDEVAKVLALPAKAKSRWARAPCS